MFILTPDELKKIKEVAIKDVGLKSLVLTENAGRTAFSVLLEELEFPVNRAAVVIGTGNNGAEGLVIARYLLEKSRELTVFLIGKKRWLKKDAKSNLKLFEKLGGKVVEVTSCEESVKNFILSADLVVDAIFGTGFKGRAKGVYHEIINWINESRAYTLSVDLPSGVNPWSGEVQGEAVYADMTVTMVFPKIGNVFYPGKLHTGKLVVADTGIPEKVVSAIVKRSTFEEEDAAKFMITGVSGGKALFIGSMEETIVAAQAAVRTGAAMAYIATPMKYRGIFPTAGADVIELPVKDKNGIFDDSSIKQIFDYGLNFNALTISRGASEKLLTSSSLLKLVKEFSGPILIDSHVNTLMGIHMNCLRNRKIPGILMLTQKELEKFLRLQGIRENPLKTRAGVKFAKDNGLIIVVKGTPAVVFSPEGHTWINSTGTPGLSSGETGHVLTGMISGLLAQGVEPVRAALLGTFLHGLAADIGVVELPRHTIIAGDLIEYIPEAIKYLRDYEEFDDDF